MRSRFHAFHPAINFCYYIGAIILLMLLAHPVFLVVTVLIILSIHWFYDNCSNLKRWSILIISSGILILIMNPLFNERGRHVLFELMGHRITLEAVTYGGISALSIMGVMAIFVSYNEVMTPNKLLFLFSKFLPQFAILLMLTLRFIPLMRRRLEEISNVQKSKGIHIHEGTWKERIHKGMLYIQVLLTFSLEEAIQTADSMNARGYGRFRRTTYEYYRLTKTDIFALGYLVIVLLFILYGRYLGLGKLAIYPLMETMNLHGEEILTLVLTILFIGFPLLVELGEVVRWRLFN